MYNFVIPKKLLEELWRLREYAGRGPIAAQIRKAIDDYISSQREEISQIEEVIRQQQQDAETD